MNNKTYFIKAQFKGQNSLGYKAGRTYVLEVVEFGLFDQFRLGVALKIRRQRDKSGDCPYQSVQSFLDNWNTKGIYVK